MDYPTCDYTRVPDPATTLVSDDAKPRAPCVLVLDTLASMRGAPLAEVTAGLQAFQQALLADPLARRRVGVAVVTFGGAVPVVQDFVSVEQFRVPTLEAAGNTPLGAAVGQALDLVDERLRAYRTGRVPCTRPWVFLITDGVPTGAWEDAAARAQRASAAKQVVFLAFWVQRADMAVLARFAPPYRVWRWSANLAFGELWKWFAEPSGCATAEPAGREVRLPDPSICPPGWPAA